MFEFVVQDREARIVIDRGTRRNAVPVAGWNELEKCVRAANTSKASLITITSADPASFCAGADMVELHALAEDGRMRRKFAGSMDSAFGWIRRTNKPTVALISGGCYGVGVALATACDIRVARPDADFAVTPARFGLSYPQTDVEALVRLVGPGHAARMIYGCEHYDGRAAERLGLVELVDEGEDLGRDLIDRIAANASSSLCSLKATMLGRWGSRERFETSFASPDFARAAAQYRGGRG
ncbi:enoyl-CoA hydratase/isomerase family protein [Sphingomonas sp.]|uniref:enoyl-CoA hydratase/isomerase family protein n=1 Tax=Sphingomonas sp. TaxID=28214 RepID=UPI003B0036FC